MSDEIDDPTLQKPTSGSITSDILQEDPDTVLKFEETMNKIKSLHSNIHGIGGMNNTLTSDKASDRLNTATRLGKKVNPGAKGEGFNSVFNHIDVDNNKSQSTGFSAFISQGQSKYRLRGEWRKVYKLVDNIKRAFEILAETVVSPDDYTKKSVRVTLEGSDDTKQDDIGTEVKELGQRLLNASGLPSKLTADLIYSYRDGGKYYVILPIDEVLGTIKSNDDNNMKSEVVMEAFEKDQRVKDLFSPLKSNNMFIETEGVGDNPGKLGLGGGLHRLNDSISSAVIELESYVASDQCARSNVIRDGKLKDKDGKTPVGRDDIYRSLNMGVKKVTDACKVYDARVLFAQDLKVEAEMESFKALTSPSLTEMESTVFDLGDRGKSKVKDILGLGNLGNHKPFSISSVVGRTPDVDKGKKGKNTADIMIESNDMREIKGSLIKELDVNTVFPIIHNKKCYGYVHILDNEGQGSLNTGAASNGADSMMTMGGGSGANASFFDSIATTFNAKVTSLGMINGNGTEKLDVVRDITEQAVLSKLTGKDMPLTSEGSIGERVLHLLYDKANSDKDINMVFIPEEHMIEYVGDRDEHGYPVSLIDSSLFVNLVYLSLYITDIITRIDRANDVRLWDVEIGKMNTDASKTVASFMQEVQGSAVTIDDLGNIDTILNKLGSNRGNFFTAKKEGQQLFDVNTLPGQDYNQEQVDFSDYASPTSSVTGVPPSAMNNLAEDEYSRSIRVQVGSFLLKVLKFQLNPSQQQTKATRILTMNELIYKLRNVESGNKSASDGELLDTEALDAADKATADLMDDKSTPPKDVKDKPTDDDIDNDVIDEDEEELDETNTPVTGEKTALDDKTHIESMLGRVKDLNARLAPPANLQAQNTMEIFQTLNELTNGYAETFVNRSKYKDPEEADMVISNLKAKIADDLFGHVIESEKMFDMVKQAEHDTKEQRADRDRE